MSSVVWSLIQGLSLSELLSALIGGGFALIGTVYSLRRQQSQRNKRLRRALISEIRLVEAGQLHLIASTMRTDKSGSTPLDAAIKEEYSEIKNSLFYQLGEEHSEELVGEEEMKKSVMKNAGDTISNVNLSTPIWDNNTDKIGDLEVNEIQKIIYFYRLLNICKENLNKTIMIVENNPSNSASFDSSMWELQNNAEALAEMKKQALGALDADEFMEIQDSYLVYEEDEETPEETETEESG